MKEIVKYHNNVHTASLRKFNSVELNIFMALMSRMRDKEDEEVIFTFDDIKKLIRWTGKNNNDFVKLLDTTYKKLIECNIHVENEEALTRFVIFTRYSIVKTRSEIRIKVNEEFRYVLNALFNNFTRFELDEFISIKSSYSKEFYRRMKQFRRTGFWKVSLEEFKRVLDIPENYNIADINKRVLAPILDELGDKYKVKIVKIYDNNKRGRPSVCGFEFTFFKEDVDDKIFDTVDVIIDIDEKKTKKHATHKKEKPQKKRDFDMEFDEKRYLGRTIRVRDQQFDRFNCLKIRSVVVNPEDGRVSVDVHNMDDGYDNTLRFESLKIWDSYFNKYLL